MIIEIGLCFALYSLGTKIYREIVSDDLPGEDEDIINMVKDDEKNVFEKQSLSLDPTCEEEPQEDAEKRAQLYVNSSLASMGLFALGPLLGPLGLIPYFHGAIPYAKDVKKALIENREVNADVLFFLADILTLYSGNFFTAAFGLYLVHSGKLAVAKAKDNSRKLVMHLFEELPTDVIVIDSNGDEIRRSLEELKKGDIIELRAGEVIPVDGRVTEGMASIDQQALTGESQPSEKGIDDTVLANTIVISGSIRVEVERSGLETTSYQVAQLLFNSVNFKSDVQLKGEEWADRMTLPMLVTSALVLPALGPVSTAVFINGHIGVRIRLLGSLGTLRFISLASRQGVLVKDGRALEKLHQVDTILFDKTGTLTTGEPQVIKIICNSHHDEQTVIGYAAAAEQKQTHPIARAIMRKARELKLDPVPVHDAAYQIGYGISVKVAGELIRVGSDRFFTEQGLVIPEEIEAAQKISHSKGNIFVMVGVNQLVAGAIELQPEVQEGMAELVARLKARGIRHLAIVSGDHQSPTKQLADTLGMDEYYYDILPQNKGQIVEELQSQGRTVCFIGDGINDSIALKQADVSISLAGATTIAKDMAEIIFMDGNISSLDKLVALSVELDSNLKNSLKICLVPSVVNVAGAFLLNFNIMAALLVNVGCNFAGMANVMLPVDSVSDSHQNQNSC